MKKINGVITKIIDQRTVKVQTSYRKKHSLYHKYYTRTKNFLVDVDGNKKELKIGDNISFANCKPISRSKKWKLI